MPLLVVRHRSGDLFVACLWEQQSRREATEMNFKACFLFFLGWVGGLYGNRCTWICYNLLIPFNDFCLGFYFKRFADLHVAFFWFRTNSRDTAAMPWQVRLKDDLSDLVKPGSWGEIRFVAIGRWVRVEVSDRYANVDHPQAAKDGVFMSLGDGTHVFFMCFQTHSLHSLRAQHFLTKC